MERWGFCLLTEICGELSDVLKVSIQSQYIGTDVLELIAHCYPLSGIGLATNGDGKLSVTDFLQVKAHILGKGAIQAR